MASDQCDDVKLKSSTNNAATTAMRFLKRIFVSVLPTILGAGSILFALAPESTAQEVRGAGSTFAHPIIYNWAQLWMKDGQTNDRRFDYQPVGSSAGILRIKQKTVDFGASDMPLKPEELEKSGLIQFPIVIGGVVPVVNIDGIAPGALKLTGEILADIYLGKIERWNDPAIRLMNPELKLPNRPIGVIHRTDGSGTTFTWVSFLASSSPEWKEKVGVGTSVRWPTGTGFKGNDGVQIAIKNAKNSIAYIEYSYVMREKLAYALVRNRAGNFVKPDTATFQAAAARADWRRTTDFYLLLTEISGDDVYPLAASTFILMPKRAISPEGSQTTLKFFKWTLENGAKEAARLGYVPIPNDLAVQIQQYWSETFKSDT